MTARACRRAVDTICDVGGVRVGHGTEAEGFAARSAVVSVRPAAMEVHVRDMSTRSRETDVLSTMNAMDGSGAAFLLTGGSTFGPAAADGALRYLGQLSGPVPQGGHAPLVPGAVIHELKIGTSWSRPDSSLGYKAGSEAFDSQCAYRNLGELLVCRNLPHFAGGKT